MQQEGKRENQHYVPKSILRRFLVGDPQKEQIWVYDKHTERPYFTNIKNVASEKDFYEFSQNGETISFEASLQKLEDKANDVLSKIVNNQTVAGLTALEKGWVYYFIAVQFFRTRQFRESLKSHNYQLKEQLTEIGMSEQQLAQIPIDEEGLKQISFLHLSKSVPEIAGYLKRMFWVLYRTKSVRPFFTSDNPVTLHNDTPRTGLYGNLGFRVPGIQVHLPLSSQLTLALWCPTIYGKAKMDFEEVKLKNEKLIQECLSSSMIDRKQKRHFVREFARILIKEEKKCNKLDKGLPFDCESEHVEFLNSLQVCFSHQRVFSTNEDFSLVQRMLKDDSAYKTGHSPKVDSLSSLIKDTQS